MAAIPLNEQQETLINEWDEVLSSEKFPEIKDTHRKFVTAQLLENQQKALTEDAQTTTQNIAGYDPVLISMVRRAAPLSIAYEICGVQPMKQPTGLVFAMKARYQNRTGDEALFDRVKTNHSGAGNHVEDNPFLTTSTMETGTGMGTIAGEESTSWNSMTATIEKILVEVKTRQLRADYSIEIAQDWKAVHGMDAETELANILASEIVLEQNQELVRTVYKIAKQGAQFTQTAGTYDILADSDGRWFVERIKGLVYAINRDANQIAKETRRGRGNILITSADVASALQMAGYLSFTPALAADTSGLDIDITGTTFAGVMGKFRVYIDPFLNHDGYVIGYKGSNQYDAGLFWCPYVPLQMFRATNVDNFQPAIGFKTRYGLVSNPFTTANANENVYYRKVAVANL